LIADNNGTNEENFLEHGAQDIILNASNSIAAGKPAIEVKKKATFLR